MKTKYILKGLLSSIFLLLVFSSCENYNVDLIDELLVDRAFSPIGVKAIVRNQTNVELNWTVNEGVDHYVVEFSADDENFTTIFKTLNVSPAQLPVTVALEGETTYSIRIKAVSATGLEDSKWVVGKVTTLSEQIFTSIIDGDIASKEATLRWIPGSNVTKIVLTPGDITHIITAQEKESGIATVTGLSAETSYQASLFNVTKKRGTASFTTGIDVGDGILVKNTEDLLVVIANANSGAKLFLEPGDYKSFGTDGVTPSTDITLAKSITISGIPGKARPVLHYKITANAGTSNVSLLNLDLDGTGLENASVFTVASTTASTFTSILISGCKIHDFTRALLNASSATNSTITSFLVENCEVTNVNTNNGVEFINVRTAYIASMILKNSTFNKCSTSRDFIRMDDISANVGTGKTSNVLVESCTINALGMTVSNRFMYVRFVSNVCVVKNTLFSNTLAIYSSNQALTTLPVFTNNNYFNSPNFKDTTIASNKVDATGTTLNPGFTDAATGDFTISNQTLKDNLVGDPRWIK